jgi:hypothetical protein
METEHTETVVEKVTHYVKEILGIPQDDVQPEVNAKPDYDDIAPALHFNDEAVEETRLGAAPGLSGRDGMPVAGSPYLVSPVDVDLRREYEGVDAFVGESREPYPMTSAPELSTQDAMRIEPGRHPEKTAAELNAESASLEDGV